MNPADVESLALLVFVNTGHDIAYEDAYALAELIVDDGWTKP